MSAARATTRKRRALDAASAVGLYLATLALYVAAASRTGLGAGETARLRSVSQAADVMRRLSQEGVPSLSHAILDATFAPSRGAAAVPNVLAGYLLALLDERWSFVPPLLRARMGLLVVAALAVPVLFMLCRTALGFRGALVAAVALALMPRLVHEAAITSPDGLVITSWLFVLLIYARFARRWPLGGGILTGIAFGVALGVSHTAVALLVLIPAHFAFRQGKAWVKRARSGQLELPGSALWMIALGLPVFVLTTPWLWFDTLARLRDLLLAVLSPTIAPTLYDGVVVSAAPVPRGFAAHAMMLTTPTATVALAWLGVVAAAGHLLLPRAGSGTSVEPREDLGALACLGLILTLVGPAFMPEMLTTFPPPVTLALPFLSMAAGLGSEPLAKLLERSLPLSFCERRSRRSAIAAMGVAAMLAPALQQSLHEWSTSAGAFAPLGGGPKGVLRRRAIAVTDESAASLVADAIDRLNRSEVALFAPSVPWETWENLRTFGLLRTNVRAARSEAEADLVVTSAAASSKDSKEAARPVGGGGPPLSAVVRDGATLFTMYRGGR